MKLLRAKHEVVVLTGAAARHFLDAKAPTPLAPWASAVAVCTCGWEQPFIHGEAAEAAAVEHRA